MNESCERYVVKEYRDGAIRISYAPSRGVCHSDEHMREYTAYSNCEECGGTGRVLTPVTYWRTGGYYYKYCDACLKRFYSEPLREWALFRTRTLWDAARVVHKTELKEAGLYKLLEAYSRDELSGDEEEKINSIKRGVRERYERLKTRHEEKCESLNVWG